MKYKVPSIVVFNNNDIAEFEALAGDSSSSTSCGTKVDICGCNALVLCICDAK